MAGGKTLERLQVLITADGSGLASGLNEAANKADKFGKKLSRLGGTLTRNVTAPIAGIGAVSIKAFADFDQAMNQSVAIMGDVSDAMRSQMGDAAKQVARTTTVSATQAGEAFFFLASAGLDATQSIAALPQVAAFAQAGMFDMSRATDLLTDAQSALGLASDDAQQNLLNMTRVSDVLVKANTLANASVEQFSTALTTEAGAALKSFGIDMEEGVAVLAAFADQGVKGEKAGSGLSRILRLMASAATNNSEELDKLGIEIFDAEGNMRNMADIVANLEVALGGMSDAQRTAALESIGFSARVQGVLLPLLGTSDAIRDYEAGLRDAGGTTADVADNQLKSFSAQMGLVKDNVIVAAIELGEVMAPTIAKLGGFVGTLASKIGELNPTVVRWGVVIAAVAAAIGPVLLIVGQLSIAVGALLPVLAALTGPIGLVVAAVGLAGAAIFKWREEIGAFISGALEPLKPIFASLIEVFQAFGGLIMEIAGPILKPLAQVLGVVLVGALKTLVAGLQLTVEVMNLTLVPALKGVAIAVRFMTDAFIAGKELTAEAFGAMVGFVENMVARIRELMGAGIRAAFGPALDAIDKVKGAFKGLFDAVVGNSFIPDMIDAISKQMDRLGPEMVGKVARDTDAASGLFGTMASNISRSVQSVLQMVQSVLQKLSGGGGFLGGLAGGIGGFLSGGPLGAGLGFAGGIGLFAEGGTINAGDIGIVGEAGPEIVSGPAQVTPMGDLTIRLDTSSMPPIPRGLSPQEAAIHSWYRQLFSEMVLDGKARGVLA